MPISRQIALKTAENDFFVLGRLLARGCFGLRRALLPNYLRLVLLMEVRADQLILIRHGERRVLADNLVDVARVVESVVGVTTIITMRYIKLLPILYAH